MRQTTVRSVLLLLAVAWCSVARAQVTVLPTEGKAVGVATSSTEGRWLVFRAAPFGMVQATTVTTEGVTRAIWEGEAGEYTAVLIPADQAKPLEFGTVTLGKGSDDDDDDPDPPPPGARQVVVIAEATTRPGSSTAPRETAIKTLRDYVREKHGGENWRLYDPDQVDASGRTPTWLQEFVDDAKAVGIPAILIYDRDKLVKAARLPTPGSSAATGQAAGEAAIKIVKGAGG